MSDIPQWAIDEALKRCGINPDCSVFADWRDGTYAKAVQLFAEHIAEHEEPPVDPLLVEAENIRNQVNRDRMPTLTEAALRGLRRGIELAESKS